MFMEVSTLQADDMCSLPAMGYDFDPPHLHTVVMTDLVSPLVWAFCSISRSLCIYGIARMTI